MKKNGFCLELHGYLLKHKENNRYTIVFNCFEVVCWLIIDAFGEIIVASLDVESVPSC